MRGEHSSLAFLGLAGARLGQPGMPARATTTHAMTTQLTSERELRRAFWRENPALTRRPGRQNAQPTDTRITFVDWLDAAARSGRVSNRLAARATL